MTTFLGGIDIDPYWFPCDGPFLGVPHGWNVLTNLPFLVVGLWGLARLRRSGGPAPGDLNRAGLWVSVALLAFGSGAYHLWLTPASLAADRVAICGILSFVLAELLAAVRPGLRRPAVSFGLLASTQVTVVIWLLGATSWFYGALQALGALAAALLAVRGGRSGRLPRVAVRGVFGFIGCYALAKVAELVDQPICDATEFVGGHPLKHLLAAAGLLAVLPWLGSSTAAVSGESPGS